MYQDHEKRIELHSYDSLDTDSSRLRLLHDQLSILHMNLTNESFADAAIYEHRG